jgi:hypothetical protein
LLGFQKLILHFDRGKIHFRSCWGSPPPLLGYRYRSITPALGSEISTFLNILVWGTAGEPYQTPQDGQGGALTLPSMEFPGPHSPGGGRRVSEFFPDKGCRFAPSCLNCPFPECMEEHPEKKPALLQKELVRERRRRRIIIPAGESYYKSDLWFSPRDIIFDRQQVLWLFEHLAEIREGNWPSRPTGYMEPKVQKSPSRHAPFEAPVGIAAELLVRLENAGQDGAMCKMVFVYGEPEESIARHWHISVEAVRRRIDRVLLFCCGWKRKNTYRQSWRYSSWAKQVNYRANLGEKTPVSGSEMPAEP